MLRIGNIELVNPVVLAPMAAVTNPPFRKLCREQGAGLVVTEMVSAKGILGDDPKTWRYVDLQPDEHPVCVQLFGCVPDELAAAAERVVAAGADAVDVNMGCPMKKVVKTGRGAALLKEPVKIERIMRAMSDAVSVPVTAKIRAGWETSNAVDVVNAVEQGGGAAVTIHGRTRSEMYDHHVDLDLIAEAKAASGIPIIGNGDVRDVVSAQRMLDATGCDGVMVARGCLGNPWVFRELAAWFERGERLEIVRTPARLREMVRRHFSLYVETFGEKKSCLDFRRHAVWYFKETPAHAVLRSRMRGITSAEDMLDCIDACCEALVAEPLAQLASPNSG